VAPLSTNGPWIGEYFGDVMLVNGKIWPTLAVEPAVDRFDLLNGCNAGILSVRIVRSNDQPVPTYIIGAEGGLLPAGSPVANQQAGDGPGRAVRRDLRLPRSRGSDAVHQEHQPADVPAAGSLQDPLVVTAVNDLTSLGPPLLSGGTNRRSGRG
jgi:hypothetical protein